MEQLLRVDILLISIAPIARYPGIRMIMKPLAYLAMDAIQYVMHNNLGQAADMHARVHRVDMRLTILTM